MVSQKQLTVTFSFFKTKKLHLNYQLLTKQFPKKIFFIVHSDKKIDSYIFSDRDTGYYIKQILITFNKQE